ncbi:hypothetical protein [Tumebacillus lipolyticus]|uniref:ABC transporter permease n=1 Tax=Tumebacillus lipolyticus TaxID=1280370 RepID=A0ABW4ZUU5_9BACL
MSKILSSFSVEIKLLRRSYWTWLFFFLSLAFIGYTFLFFMQEKDPGGMLVASAFVVQGGIFVSLLLGLSLARREQITSSEEIYLSLPDGFGAKIIGKVAALCSLLLLFLVSTLLMLYAFYLQADVATALYKQAFLYLVMYWVVPFFIAGILGMVVGVWIKSKGVYALLLLFWTLIGPLNVSIYQLPMAVTGVNASPVLHFLNLGQTDYTAPYEPVYGLPLESFRWNHRVLFLVLVIALLWMLTLLKNYGRKIPIKHWMMLSLLVGVCAYTTINLVDSQQLMISFGKSDSLDDRNYYKQNQESQLQSKSAFRINSYEIDLQTKDSLRANVKMQVIPQEDTDRLVFTLYHSLRVTKVEDAQAQPLHFQQLGDQTEIIFPASVKKGQSIEVTVEYAGLSSAFYFANEQAIMLPNYFPWLPAEGSYQAMRLGAIDLRRTPLAPQHEVEYTLRYHGPVKLYTNLPQAETDVWKGKVLNGITVVGGMMTETKIGTTRVIYPVTLQDMLVDVPDYFKRTHQALEIINQDWKLPIPAKLPETVFFLSTPTETNSYTGDIWLMQDHLLVNISQSYNLGGLQYETAQLEKMFLASIRSKETVAQPLDMHLILAYSYEYWVRIRQGESSKAVLTQLQESNIEAENREGEERLKGIMTFVEQHANDSQVMRKFFDEWIARLQQKPSLTWEELATRVSAS